jgi:hypothetical protein
MQSPETEEKWPEDRHEAAVHHVSDARSLLDSLRGELDRHPKLEEAIVKLELALENLTIKSGGML